MFVTAGYYYSFICFYGKNMFLSRASCPPHVIYLVIEHFTLVTLVIPQSINCSMLYIKFAIAWGFMYLIYQLHSLGPTVFRAVNISGIWSQLWEREWGDERKMEHKPEKTLPYIQLGHHLLKKGVTQISKPQQITICLQIVKDYNPWFPEEGTFRWKSIGQNLKEYWNGI